jgi:hypothetical protein
VRLKNSKSQINLIKPLDLTKIIRNQNPYKFQSRDLMDSTGNKFSDLHAVAAKIDQVKPRKDKTSNELDYEKEGSECFFQPQISKRSNDLATLRRSQELTMNGGSANQTARSYSNMSQNCSKSLRISQELQKSLKKTKPDIPESYQYKLRNIKSKVDHRRPKSKQSNGKNSNKENNQPQASKPKKVNKLQSKSFFALS